MADRVERLRHQIAQARENVKALNECPTDENIARAYAYWLGRLESLVNVFSVLELRE